MTLLFNDSVGSTCNFTVANGGGLVYRLKELAKAAGWVHLASSDGTNVSNTTGNANDQIGSAAEMNTNNAWWVGRHPTGRAFIFRRGTTELQWMIAYVPLDAGNAAQNITTPGTTTAVPLFANRQIILGTLPDTTAAWMGSPASSRWTIAAQTSPPYGFICYSWDASGVGGAAGGGFLVDPMEAGSFNPLDQDPYVIYAPLQSLSTWRGFSDTVAPIPLGNTGINEQTSPNGAGRGYYRKNLNGEAFLPYGAMLLGQVNRSGTIAAMLKSGRDPYDSRKVTTWALHWGRLSDSSGSSAWQYKGRSTMLQWKGGRYPSGYLLRRFAANDKVVCGDVVADWDPSISPSY